MDAPWRKYAHPDHARLAALVRDSEGRRLTRKRPDGVYGPGRAVQWLRSTPGWALRATVLATLSEASAPPASRAASLLEREEEAGPIDQGLYTGPLTGIWTVRHLRTYRDHPAAAYAKHQLSEEDSAAIDPRNGAPAYMVPLRVASTLELNGYNSPRTNMLPPMWLFGLWLAIVREDWPAPGSMTDREAAYTRAVWLILRGGTDTLLSRLHTVGRLGGALAARELLQALVALDPLLPGPWAPRP